MPAAKKALSPLCLSLCVYLSVYGEGKEVFQFIKGNSQRRGVAGIKSPVERRGKENNMKPAENVPVFSPTGSFEY